MSYLEDSMTLLTLKKYLADDLAKVGINLQLILDVIIHV